MKILVLNSGSSSIKFKLFAMNGPDVLATGLIEQIGEARGRAVLHGIGDEELVREEEIGDHRHGLEMMREMLSEAGVIGGISELDGIGHRVVHGGEDFHMPTVIDADVIAAIEKLSPLAPLHNPANLEGIRVASEGNPDLPQVAVFDTAFHQSIPKHAYLYALPYRLYEQEHVRRYGFHGTSHQYVARAAAAYLKKDPVELNMITLHLGNGASAAAIRAGKSVDTSMGMTPLEGLIMGTRSGDIDPAILFYLARNNGTSIDELDTLLNKQSGLKGICGTNDMREIRARADDGDERSVLAMKMVSYRLKKYIGAYMAVLGRVDCIVFTGGIGEHTAAIREESCSGMEEGMGILLDVEKNRTSKKGVFSIEASESRVKVLVVPTDEELEIAFQTQTAIVAAEGNKQQEFL